MAKPEAPDAPKVSVFWTAVTFVQHISCKRESPHPDVDHTNGSSHSGQFDSGSSTQKPNTIKSNPRHFGTPVHAVRHNHGSPTIPLADRSEAVHSNGTAVGSISTIQPSTVPHSVQSDAPNGGEVTHRDLSDDNHPDAARTETSHAVSPGIQDYGHFVATLEEYKDCNTLGLYGEKPYIPRHIQTSLVTREIIQHILPDISTHLKDFICDKAPKTFLITSRNLSKENCLLAMKAFRNHDFTDGCLPIESLTRNARCKSFDTTNISRRGPCRPGCSASTPWSCSKTHGPKQDSFHHNCWTRKDANDFFDTQWTLLVHSFSMRATGFEDIHSDALLPFCKGPNSEGSANSNDPEISKNLKDCKHVIGGMSGNFSDVVQATMLGDHQDVIRVERGTVIHVAIKTLKNVEGSTQTQAEALSREASAHYSLNSLNHSHLIKGIAAFRQDGKYNLVLEWADGGTLREFWRDSRPQLTGGLILELISQLHGVVQALGIMHNTGKVRSRRGSQLRESPEVQRSSEETRTRIQDQARGHSAVADEHQTIASPEQHLMPQTSISAPNPKTPDIILHAVEDSFGSRNIHSDLNQENENWRHGDIKPENILRFKGKGSVIGTLKLADFGRAKRHYFVTIQREGNEYDQWRTKPYEAPDLYIQKDRSMSRLYDVWSLGCVFFESVMWILHGHRWLQEFAVTYLGQNVDGTPFWERFQDSAIIRGSVSDCLAHLLREDPECNQNTAMRDLVTLIKDQMLVVKLPIDTALPKPGERSNTEAIEKKLKYIKDKAGRDLAYQFSGAKRDGLRTPSLSPNNDGSKTLDVLNNPSLSTQQRNAYTHNLSNKWLYNRDDNFAELLVQSIEDDRSCHNLFDRPDFSMCDECSNIDIDVDTSNVILTRSVCALESTRTACTLCDMLYQSAVSSSIKIGDIIKVTRSNGALVLNGIPALRVCCSIDSTRRFDSSEKYIPVGLPRIPDAGSISHIRILKQWLIDCNRFHCCNDKLESIYRPKRLIDVGIDPKIKTSRLVDSSSAAETGRDILEYIALSHPWGRPTNSNPHFCSTVKNIGDHRKGIPDEVLPKTFQHAVQMTRKLGMRYLWIDSICILQGYGGDFHEEAQYMQDIFNSAAFVIAASSGGGMSSGFLSTGTLRRREERKYVALPPSSQGSNRRDIFVCESPDNFQKDVIEGPLSKRGWVLQERALARRTMYFTDNQTYWECGEGIRCETLSKLTNNESAFLGDPKFPAYAVQQKRGAQQYLFTRLYEQYSRLSFTHSIDKPVAIAGLEQRLTKTFKDRSGAGIFEKHRGRCLLWVRAPDITSLARISFQSSLEHANHPTEAKGHNSRQPPSWSWMSYVGGIVFLNPPGRRTTWEALDLHLTGNSESSWLYVSDDTLSWRANIRGFTVDADVVELSGFDVVYDHPNDSAAMKIKKCIVIGRIGVATDDKASLCYVLVVSPKNPQAKESAWERVGAGCIPAGCIDFKSGDAKAAQIE